MTRRAPCEYFGCVNEHVFRNGLHVLGATATRTSRRKARVREDMDILVGRHPVMYAMFSTLPVYSGAFKKQNKVKAPYPRPTPDASIQNLQGFNITSLHMFLMCRKD